MFRATGVLRAAQAERTPLIKFIGKRTTPATIDSSMQPHPASPTGKLPESFKAGPGSSHASFSSYRDHAQQFGPLRKTISKSAGARIGNKTGNELGSVKPPSGIAFDRSELPSRFARIPMTTAEMEAIETGGAAML